MAGGAGSGGGWAGAGGGEAGTASAGQSGQVCVPLDVVTSEVSAYYRSGEVEVYLHFQRTDTDYAEQEWSYEAEAVVSNLPAVSCSYRNGSTSTDLGEACERVQVGDDWACGDVIPVEVKLRSIRYLADTDQPECRSEDYERSFSFELPLECPDCPLVDAASATRTRCDYYVGEMCFGSALAPSPADQSTLITVTVPCTCSPSYSLPERVWHCFAV